MSSVGWVFIIAQISALILTHTIELNTKSYFKHSEQITFHVIANMHTSIDLVTLNLTENLQK